MTKNNDTKTYLEDKKKELKRVIDILQGKIDKDQNEIDNIKVMLDETNITNPEPIVETEEDKLAKQLEQKNVTEASVEIQQMNPTKAATILGKMETQKASQILNEMAGKMETLEAAVEIFTEMAVKSMDLDTGIHYKSNPEDGKIVEANGLVIRVGPYRILPEPSQFSLTAFKLLIGMDNKQAAAILGEMGSNEQQAKAAAHILDAHKVRSSDFPFQEGFTLDSIDFVPIIVEMARDKEDQETDEDRLKLRMSAVRILSLTIHDDDQFNINYNPNQQPRSFTIQPSSIEDVGLMSPEVFHKHWKALSDEDQVAAADGGYYIQDKTFSQMQGYNVYERTESSYGATGMLHDEFILYVEMEKEGYPAPHNKPVGDLKGYRALANLYNIMAQNEMWIKLAAYHMLSPFSYVAGDVPKDEQSWIHIWDLIDINNLAAIIKEQIILERSKIRIYYGSTLPSGMIVMYEMERYSGIGFFNVKEQAYYADKEDADEEDVHMPWFDLLEDTQNNTISPKISKTIDILVIVDDIDFIVDLIVSLSSEEIGEEPSAAIMKLIYDHISGLGKIITKKIFNLMGKFKEDDNDPVLECPIGFNETEHFAVTGECYDPDGLNENTKGKAFHTNLEAITKILSVFVDHNMIDGTTDAKSILDSMNLDADVIKNIMDEYNYDDGNGSSKDEDNND